LTIPNGRPIVRGSPEVSISDKVRSILPKILRENIWNTAGTKLIIRRTIQEALWLFYLAGEAVGFETTGLSCMKAFVGVNDFDWFTRLLSLPIRSRRSKLTNEDETFLVSHGGKIDRSRMS
jgi:hypothetical protein